SIFFGISQSPPSHIVALERAKRIARLFTRTSLSVPRRLPLLVRRGSTIGFGRAAGEDVQVDGQPSLTGNLAHHAQNVATDILHLIGRQAAVNKLANVDVLTHPTNAQEGGILSAAIPAVGIVQRFKEILKFPVYLETDEDRLMNQEFEQLTLLQAR